MTGITYKAVALWLLVMTIESLSASGKRLFQTNVVYRHGERSPLSTYPNSLYQEDFWPQGFGELSQRGIQIQYDLGKFLRTRTASLLSSRYSTYEISVRSTDFNRTLMSAQANLAGLYPPSGDQIWNPDILWQPIPVHTEKQERDYLLSIAPCPRYDLLMEKTTTTDPGYRQLEKDNAKFLAYVSEKAGFNSSLTVIESLHLQDPLFVEQLNKLTLPDWVTDDVMDTLQYLVDQSYYYYYNTLEKRKLKGGTLLNKMIVNMLDGMTTTVPENKRPKMYMYSAHDSTVAAFLSALGVFDNRQPPLGSVVGLDLIEDPIYPSNFNVEVWYRNSTDSEPNMLPLPGCGYTCDFTLFAVAMQEVIPINIVKECA